MTREEVYRTCEITLWETENIRKSEILLMPNMIDAIIDCAVEEAVKRIRDEVEE